MQADERLPEVYTTLSEAVGTATMYEEARDSYGLWRLFISGVLARL